MRAAQLVSFAMLAMATAFIPILPSLQAQEADAPAAKTKEVEIEGLTLNVPADWKQQTPSNRLRLAQFDIPAAEGDEKPTEMVVSNFGGTAGGIDANVTRWIGQFGNQGRTAKVVKGTSPNGTYYLVDIAGTYNMPVGPPILRKTEELPNAEMAGIILETENQGNFFLKMAGPKNSVAAQIDALRASIGGDSKTESPYEVK